MSIIPKQWSAKDEAGTIPDASMRFDIYFNTADNYLYRVIDFILVQEPGKERDVYPETRKGREAMPSYTEVAPGDERWYIVLEKNDGLGDRKAFRYDDFKNECDHYFHRVKNDKQKAQIRDIPGDALKDYYRQVQEQTRDEEVEGQRTLRTDRSRD